MRHPHPRLLLLEARLQALPTTVQGLLYAFSYNPTEGRPQPGLDLVSRFYHMPATTEKDRLCQRLGLSRLPPSPSSTRPPTLGRWPRYQRQPPPVVADSLIAFNHLHNFSLHLGEGGALIFRELGPRATEETVCWWHRGQLRTEIFRLDPIFDHRIDRHGRVVDRGLLRYAMHITDSPSQGLMRLELADTVHLLTESQARTFRATYGRGLGASRSLEDAYQLPLEQVVAEIPSKDLANCYDLVQRTIGLRA